MNSIRISTLLRFLGLVLLTVCFHAGHASAQVFQGEFTLPFQAHWGQATLAPGDYSFRLNNVNAICTLQLYRGNRTVALILAQAMTTKDSGHAELTFERNTVRSLNLPAIGVFLEYAPRHAKHLTAPEEREMARIVPVTATDKSKTVL